jgi:hypothetical protein
MAEHEAFCDENHTPRQACNRNLAVGSEAVIVSPPEQPSAPPPAPTAPEVIFASSVVVDDEVIVDEDAPRPVIATEEMPAPSPWAARAWEDTAAAVGATANPAPPPLDTPVDPWGADFNEEESRGHAALIVMAIVALVVVFFILRRRRSRHSESVRTGL